MGISPVGWAFLALVTLYIPFVAVRTARRLRKPEGRPSRTQLLLSVLISQVFNLIIALAVAKYEWISLFSPPHVDWRNFAYAFAFLIPGLGTLPMRWNWRTLEEKKKVIWRLPQKPADLLGWGLVSLGAGTTEEIAFRGVMFQLWLRVIGFWWPTTILCSAVFAISHYIQGWRSMTIIFGMAIATHAIVLATGDLYTVMAIHFIYDLLAGWMFLILAKRDGLLTAPQPSS